MDFINKTDLLAELNTSCDPDGRERLVVVIKGTFSLTAKPKLLDKQQPLIMSDEFTGEPGESAVKYESDFAPIKPRCDVLLLGCAYAPGGRPTESVRVGLHMGNLHKVFDVVGNRFWEKTLVSMAPGNPRPFLKMPISYDRAYGGFDVDPEDPDKVAVYPLNPIGVGFRPKAPDHALARMPVPNTQELGNPISTASGQYRPMSFGPLARNFSPRREYAGTYDANWQENQFPFLPKDFDTRFFQAAPEDQQVNYPQGGEKITLENLTPIGKLTFCLPRIQLPVEFAGRKQIIERYADLDTIFIEPEENRFSCTWRTSTLLKRDVSEIKLVIIGHMDPIWYYARKKSHGTKPSKEQLVLARRKGA